MKEIIKNYDKQPLFSDFLPGIAGEKGIPAWCFFVNRGQGVASFGTRDKDHAIMEFRPAHCAYQDVQTKGFRTFLKCNGNVYELFADPQSEKQMELGLNSLCLTSREKRLPILATAQYFLLPNENVGALVRGLTIQNCGKTPLELELLDGMPAIVPFGIGDWHLKCMTQTAKAWMEVANMGSGAVGFRVRASLEDSARVEPINGFTFALFMDETGKQLPLFCDPSAIFSYDSAFLRPNGFYEKNLSELRRAHQAKQNIFQCCFAGMSYSL